MDRPPAIGGFERAIKDPQVLVLNVRRAFDRAVLIDVIEDLRCLLDVVPELQQGYWNDLVDDLDEPAAHQSFVFNKRQVRLNARGVAVHHETDRARWG